MNPLHAFYLLSITGIVIFFIAGYITSSLRGAKAAASRDDKVSTDAAALREALKAALAREAAQRGLLQSAQASDAERKDLAAQLSGLRRQTDDAVDQRRLLEQELAQLKASRAIHSAAENETEQLRRDLEQRDMHAADAVRREKQLRAELAQAQAECSRLWPIEHKSAQQDGASAKLRAELEQARRDRVQLLEQLDTANKASSVVASLTLENGELQARLETSAAHVARAQREAGQLRAQAQQVAARVKELEGALEQAHKHAEDLRTQLGEAGGAARVVSQLQVELRALRGALQQAEACAATVELLRQDNVALQEELQRAADAAARARVVETEVRELRTQLTTAVSRAAHADSLQEENHRLREELQHASAAADSLSQRDDELKDLRMRIGMLDAQVVELERVRHENRDLRESLAELEGCRDAGSELERLRVTHKQLRLQAELLERRVEELGHLHAETAELRAHIQELTGRAAQAEELRERARLLEARLFAAGTPVDDIPMSSSSPMPASASGSMDRGLAQLVDDATRSVVLADRYGLLVAAAGDKRAQEGLAALCGLFGHLAEQAQALIPVTDIASVSMQDRNELRVHCRFFQTGTDDLAVATLGKHTPPNDQLARVIAALTANIENPTDARVEAPPPAVP